MSEHTSNEIPGPTGSSSKEREQSYDIRDQIATLIALTVENLRNAASTKRPESNTSKLVSFIIAFTALIAGIGSLAGSSQSLYVSMQTSQTQREIQERQKQLDARQDEIALRDRLGAENTRIGNIWISIPKASCGGIPLDENQKWKSYCTCLSGQGCTKDSDFSMVADEKRFQCLIPIGICKRNP